MDEEEDIYELFLMMMEKIQGEDPTGRMRIISKNPRYAADAPAAQPKNKTI